MNQSRMMTHMLSEIIGMKLKHEAEEEEDRRLVKIQEEYLHNRYHYSDQIGHKEFQLMTRKLLREAVDDKDFKEDTPKIPPMIDHLFDMMDDEEEFGVSENESDWVITNLYVKRWQDVSAIIEIQIEFTKRVTHFCMLCEEDIPETDCLTDGNYNFMCEECHSNFNSCR